MDPGMLVPVEKEPKYNPPNTYVCSRPHCNGGLTVSWDRFAQHFVCSACGRIDGKRTRQFFDKMKGNYNDSET